MVDGKASREDNLLFFQLQIVKFIIKKGVAVYIIIYENYVKNKRSI